MSKDLVEEVLPSLIYAKSSIIPMSRDACGHTRVGAPASGRQDPRAEIHHTTSRCSASRGSPSATRSRPCGLAGGVPGCGHSYAVLLPHFVLHDVTRSFIIEPFNLRVGTQLKWWEAA